MEVSPANKCVLQYGGSHGAKNLLICQNTCHNLSFQLIKPDKVQGLWGSSQLSATELCHFLWWTIVLFCFGFFWLFFSPSLEWRFAALCVSGISVQCWIAAFQVELLFGSETYPKNRKCGYKWQQLAGRTCSDAILELLLIFSTQFQVKHPFKLIRTITVSLEYHWRNWSHECNLSISWILRRH